MNWVPGECPGGARDSLSCLQELSPWPRVQRTKPDGDAAVLNAGWTPGSRGVDQAGAPPPEAQGREHRDGAPGVGHCFGVHSRSLHVASRFWKAVCSPDPDGVEGGGSVQELHSGNSVPMPPTLTPSQQRGRLMSEEAHGSGWLRPPISPSVGGCFSRGIWALAGLGRPLAARAAAHRCLRSACWSLRERSSMRTFLSWSRCSKRLTFICRTWTARRRGQAQRPAASVPAPAGLKPPAPSSVSSPARSPARPTAPAPFQRSGGRS